MTKKKKIILISVISVVVMLAITLLIINLKSDNKDLGELYSITFKTADGTKIAVQKVKGGYYIKKPTTPKREGYTFVAWKYKGKVFDFKTKITTNITLEAEWKKNEEEKCNVSFDTDGGSTIEKQTFIKGQLFIKPVDPTKEGYTFKGWYLDNKEFDWDISDTIEKDIILVARWEKKETTTSNNQSTSNSSNSNNSNDGSNSNSTPNSIPTPIPTPQPDPEPTPIPKTYKVVAKPVDTYSPDRILTVYENNNVITVQSIKYTNGTTLCSGSNTTVYYGDIEGLTSLILVLNDGTQVSATLN